MIISSSLLIRQAQANEAGLLSELAFQSKAYWGYDSNFMRQCRQELSYTADQIASPSFYCYLAQDNENILGFYAIESLNELIAELEALFVRPQFMRQGIGQILVQHATAFANTNSWQRLIIQGDPNAEKFYLHMGAKKIGEKESKSIPGRFLPLFEILPD